jgi:hypothetical protein
MQPQMAPNEWLMAKAQIIRRRRDFAGLTKQTRMRSLDWAAF